MNLSKKFMSIFVLLLVMVSITAPLTNVVASEFNSGLWMDQKILDKNGDEINETTIGSVVSYSIDVTQTLKDNAKVVVVDSLPEGVEYVPGTTKIDGVLQDDKDYWNNNLQNTLGASINIDILQHKIINFDVKITAKEAGSIENKAEGYIRNENVMVTASSVINVIEERIITELEVDSKYPVQGTNVKYTATIENHTGQNFEKITIGDMLPEGLAYVPGTTKVNGVLINHEDSWKNNTLTMEISPFSSDDVITIEFMAKITDSDQEVITNELTATAGDFKSSSSVSFILKT